MLIAGAIVLLLSSAAAPAAAGASTAALDAAVFVELNRVRRQPSVYLPLLTAYRSAFRGAVVYERASDEGVETEEGPKAVEEAVADLARRGAIPTLTWDDRLAASAADLAEDQRRTGLTGHQTSDGSAFEQRLGRHLDISGQAGEIIAYGETTEQAVIRAFIVDDGVPERSHRADLFTSAFRKAGIACRPHPTFGVSCVVDLSS